MDEDFKPALKPVDTMNGWKTVEVQLKCFTKRTIKITAPTILEKGMIFLEHKDPHQRLIETCLPAQLPDMPAEAPKTPWLWLEWLDLESHNEVMAVVNAFTFGGPTQKKRTGMARLIQSQITKLSSTATSTPPSSALGSDSTTPSPGADPSSAESLSGFAELKPTTA